MTMTDPVADMLTRIRNACSAGHRRVDIPVSKVKTVIIADGDHATFSFELRRRWADSVNDLHLNKIASFKGLGIDILP